VAFIAQIFTHTDRAVQPGVTQISVVSLASSVLRMFTDKCEWRTFFCFFVSGFPVCHFISFSSDHHTFFDNRNC
jgi:hypothetical protein